MNKKRNQYAAKAVAGAGSKRDSRSVPLSRFERLSLAYRSWALFLRAWTVRPAVVLMAATARTTAMGIHTGKLPLVPSGVPTESARGTRLFTIVMDADDSLLPDWAWDPDVPCVGILGVNGTSGASVVPRVFNGVNPVAPGCTAALILAV